MYVRAFEGSGVNFIDMNKWFLAMKGKSKYPLFPPNSTHWSSYGIALAADSLVHYIEKIRKIDLPHISWEKITLSHSMRYVENELGDLLNLWWPLPTPPTYYPDFIFDMNEKTRPKVITIGDSYWWGFSENQIPQHEFTNDNFWLYFETIRVNKINSGMVKDVDLKEQLFNQDVIILFATESNYQVFPFGFLEQFYRKCLPSSPESRQVKLERYIDDIRNNRDWFKSIVEKAIHNGCSVNEQLRLDAQFMVDKEQL